MTDEIVGRQSELASVERFLDSVHEGTSALLIEGEVGAGKTILWKAAIAAAARRSFRCLACRPAQSEIQLSFAALGDLFEGVLSEPLSGLPGPQRRAMEVALLRTDAHGSPPDQRAVSVGLLGVLRSIAASAPLVLAVDDIQWLDPSSARALEFAVRRLVEEPVCVIATQRAGEGRSLFSVQSSIGQGRFVHLTAGPLDTETLGQLVGSRVGTPFPRPTLVQLHKSSGGNPLFALEIARALERGEVRAEPGETLPVPRTLQELVTERLAALPADVRRALLAIAALSMPTLEAAPPALRAVGATTSALEEAVDSGLLEIEEGRIRFTHPLLASTLYSQLPREERRKLHSTLARVVADPEERARHLALGAGGPDREVASTLDAAAHIALRRGAPDAAAELSEQAFRLTPSAYPEELRRRRMDAAEHHFRAGDTARARELLEAVLSGLPAGPGRAHVLRQLAKVRYRNDSCSVAAALLTRALEEAGEDPSLRAGIERDLSWAAALCGDVGDAAEHARVALQLAERSGTSGMLPELLAAVGMTDFALGRGMPEEMLRRAVELERGSDEVPIEWQPSMMLAEALKWSGDLEEARSRFQALYSRTLELGDESSLPFLLYQMSELESWAGDFDKAESYAEEGNQAAVRSGQDPIRAFVLSSKALAEACLGRVHEARQDAETGLALGEGAGSVLGMMLNQGVLGFLELSLDHPAEAHGYLAPLGAWLHVVGIQEPGMLRFLPDEIEALIALGETDKAEQLLHPFEERGRRLGRTWAVAASARCRALLSAARGDLQRALAIAHQAVEHHEGLGQPFELARTLLVEGSIGRRMRQRVPARESTQRSLRMFEELGAALWQDRARSQMGAGESRGTGRTPLTAAERKVAELVTSGSTNKEVADRLFVSLRAVEAHLTSIYRKLGIRSRTELSVRMADGETTVSHP